jgi:hypothetical protein
MPDTTGHDATQRDERYTMTLRELEAAVAAAGVVMSRRQLMRHCAAGTFAAQKFPATNNLEEWFIVPASVDKGIADIRALQELRARRDAARPDTTGHVEPLAPIQNHSDGNSHDLSRPDTSDQSPQGGRGASQADMTRRDASDLAIFEHPYVKRLVSEIDRWQGKYQAQVHRTEEIQLKHQERLIDLQRMITIGQSKTLADFMLQAKNWIVGAESAEPSSPSAEDNSRPAATA